MKFYTEYEGHSPIILGKKKLYDNTIMTFDIETSSYLILDGRQIPAIEYLSLTKADNSNEYSSLVIESNVYNLSVTGTLVVYAPDKKYQFSMKID